MANCSAGQGWKDPSLRCDRAWWHSLGIFGLLGKEAQFYTAGAGAVSFSDAIETAKEMVSVLRRRRRWMW